MKDLVMSKNAHKIVNICAKVIPGEKAVIVTDFNLVDIAQAIADACLMAKAETVITIMEPRKIHNQPLPEAVAAAMVTADVIFVPTTWSIAHTKARTTACNAGARVINLPAIDRNLMIGGAIDEDFIENAPNVKRIAERLTRAKVARVVTDAGTDITLGIDGRDGAALCCLSHEKGQFATVPDMEARVTPLEGTSTGIIYVDGSIPMPGVGLITGKPIKVTVKDGYAIKIEGDEKADLYREMLESVGDQGAFNIAELGIGMNRCAKMMGVMLEDEGSSGTIHIACGTSAAFGGKVSTSIHLDMMIRKPSLYLDGELVQDHGVLVI